MGNMAQQINEAIAADGGNSLGDAAPVPGTDGGTPPQAPSPSAETINTEETAAGGPPETIPYARFKEVNDRLSQLKGYEELQQVGYDPDSLGRLAAFEAQFMSDPVGTWVRLADDLELPPELKQALASHSGGESTPATDGEGSTPKPSEAQSDPERERMEEAARWVEERKLAEAQAERQQAADRTLGSVIGHWTALDEKDGIDTPEHIKLTFISQAAARGGFQSPEQLAEIARKVRMDDRDQILGSAVGSRRPGSPLAVPGSGTAAAGPLEFKDLRAASQAAAADIAAGRLPTTPGA